MMIIFLDRLNEIAEIFFGDIILILWLVILKFLKHFEEVLCRV